MEKEIEFIKKIYLEEKPSFSGVEGFSDIEKRIASHRMFYAYAVIAIVVVGIVFVTLFPQNKTVNAIKGTTQKAYDFIMGPNATVLPVGTTDIKLKKISPTPIPTTEPQKVTPSPSEKEKRIESENKKQDNKLPEDVKGVSVSKDGNNSNGNSENHTTSGSNNEQKSEDRNNSGKSDKHN